jgi:hypothetical protein
VEMGLAEIGLRPVNRLTAQMISYVVGGARFTPLSGPAAE